MLERSEMNSGVNPENKRRSARIIRFPLVRRIMRASAECEHRWIFLAPGYQLCVKCGAVQRKPKNGGDE